MKNEILLKNFRWSIKILSYIIYCDIEGDFKVLSDF